MASWTVARVLAWAADDLRTRGSSTPRLEAELMLGQVLGCDRVRLIVAADRPLGEPELEAYKQLHGRRRRGEPIAYLRGEREFFGRSFAVDRRVLVPRPETEILVTVALRRTRARSLCARVLDLCTGSGCMAITLKKERPTTTVVASDASVEALAVARSNCLRLGALVTLVESDVFASLGRFRGAFDLLTANPPYIATAELSELPVDVRDFEPPAALDGGTDGLAVTRRIVAGAPEMLAPGGVLTIEVAAGGAGAVCDLFARAGFSEIERERDYAGHDRVVAGVWPGR